MNKLSFEHRLQNAGYKKIGFGAFSSVYAKKGKDFVIKVGQKDDRWQDYIEWALIKGYAGIFAPKVYSLKQYDTFYVAVMERLVATQHDIDSENQAYARESPIKRLVNTLKAGLYNDRYSCQYYENAVDLISFADDVARSGMCTDLHEGNVMIRKDGQLVLIDPLSGIRRHNPLHIKYGQIRKSQTTTVINLTMEE